MKKYKYYVILVTVCFLYFLGEGFYEDEQKESINWVSNNGGKVYPPPHKPISKSDGFGILEIFWAKKIAWGIGFENSHLKELTPLTRLPSLKKLYLVNCIIEDIEAIQDLKGLETLVLNNSSISDLTALASLSNLKELHLEGTIIVDFAPLYRLQNLTYLNLVKVDINKSQAQDIKEKLPNCKIVYD